MYIILSCFQHHIVPSMQGIDGWWSVLRHWALLKNTYIYANHVFLQKIYMSSYMYRVIGYWWTVHKVFEEVTRVNVWLCMRLQTISCLYCDICNVSDVRHHFMIKAEIRDSKIAYIYCNFHSKGTENTIRVLCYGVDWECAYFLCHLQWDSSKAVRQCWSPDNYPV